MTDVQSEIAQDNEVLQGKPAPKKSHKKATPAPAAAPKKPASKKKGPHTGPFPAEVAGLIALKQKKQAEIVMLDKAIAVASAAVRAARGEGKK